MFSRKTRILTFSFLLTVGLIAGIGVVTAETGDQAHYYGEATDTDGNPLPEGTEIFAVAEDGDGNVVDSDSALVDEDGMYAVEGAFTEKLSLTADDEDDVFYHLGSDDGPESVHSPYDLRDDTDTDGTFERNLEFDSADVAFFDVAITTELDESVKQNSSVTVEYEIENTGTLADTQTIDVTVEGAVEDVDESEELSLSGAESVTRDVSFTVDPDADTVDISISSADDEATTELDVDAPPFFNVSINDIPDEVIEGETIDVDYDVENEGDRTDTQDIEFFVDGELQDTDELTLGSSDNLGGEFSYTTDSDDVDEVTVEVASNNDTETATVDVIPTADAIDLTLDDSTIRVDKTTAATVMVEFSDGTEDDVTDEATITSQNDTIATIADATLTGESGGVVTIDAEYEQDGDTFTDSTQLEVLPIPAVSDDEDEIRNQTTVSENVTPERSETNSPVYNETADETVYGFTGATSTEEVRIQGDIADDVTTTLLNQTPPEVGEPGDDDTATVVTSQLDVPDPATDQAGNMLMNVTTDAIDDLDADADDLGVVRYNDTAEEWEELDADIEEETDDIITLRAQVPGFSLFSVTADVEADEEEEEDDEEEEEEDDGISTILLIALGLLLLILAYLIYRFYQEREDDEESETTDQAESETVTDSDSNRSGTDNS